MVKYNVYLKGFGFVKTRLTRKPKVFSKENAKKIAMIERKRWSKKPRYVRIVKLK